MTIMHHLLRAARADFAYALFAWRRSGDPEWKALADAAQARVLDFEAAL